MVGLAGMATRLPYWWEELIAIRDVEDVWRLAWKIQASFKVPSVRMEAPKGQLFTVPPVLKCIQRCEFLLDGLLCQDVRMKPHQMTLAYARALQYWVEKVNLPVSGDPHPLVICLRELRQQVGMYITCNEQEILYGLGDVLLEDERGKPPPVDSPAAMDDGDAQLSPIQFPLVENLMRPANEGEGKEQMYPSWIRVQSTQKAATTEGLPKECRSASPGGPSKPAPWDKEEKGADSMNALGTSGASIPLVEPGLKMVILTSVGRHPSTGTLFMLMLTTSMEIMNLEAPSEMEDCQRAKVKELMKEDLAWGHPWIWFSLVCRWRVALGSSQVVSHSPRQTIEDVTNLC